MSIVTTPRHFTILDFQFFICECEYFQDYLHINVTLIPGVSCVIAGVIGAIRVV